jgi:hypothetical protein
MRKPRGFRTFPDHDSGPCRAVPHLLLTYSKLMSDLDDGHRVIEPQPGSKTAWSAETLGAQNPFEPGRASFPTSGDFAAYLMTGHLGYPLGQLYGWRAASRIK